MTHPHSLHNNSHIGMEYLKSQGLSDVQAAAIIGAFTVESNLNPYAIGDTNLKEHAHGIGQWRGLRWENLHYLAQTRGKHVYDFLLQLEYTLAELASTEKLAGDKLFAATDIQDAVEAMLDYERPGGWTKKFPWHAKSAKQRLVAAKALL